MLNKLKLQLSIKLRMFSYNDFMVGWFYEWMLAILRNRMNLILIPVVSQRYSNKISCLSEMWSVSSITACASS